MSDRDDTPKTDGSGAKGVGAVMVLTHQNTAGLYRAEYCDVIIELGRRGRFQAEWCVVLGISRKTLREWGNRHPAFGEAINTANTFCQAHWEAYFVKNLTNAHIRQSMLLKLMARFGEDWGGTTQRAPKEFFTPDRDDADAQTKQPVQLPDPATMVEDAMSDRDLVMRKIEEMHERAKALGRADEGLKK